MTLDISKIKVSEQKLYIKEHNLYKYYVFYEHVNEYISLTIILKDVIGYCSVYHDSRKMNFSVNDELYDKLSDILEHILEKLNITFGDFTFVRKGE